MSGRIETGTQLSFDCLGYVCLFVVLRTAFCYEVTRLLTKLYFGNPVALYGLLNNSSSYLPSDQEMSGCEPH